MILRRAISPYPARSIADLELEDKVYRPDFEISSKFQALSKELVRISLLGLGVYGFLLKLATDTPSGGVYLRALQKDKYIVLGGTVAFAICAGWRAVAQFPKQPMPWSSARHIEIFW